MSAAADIGIPGRIEICRGDGTVYGKIVEHEQPQKSLDEAGCAAPLDLHRRHRMPFALASPSRGRFLCP